MSSDTPSYHDVYVTTKEIERKRLFDLPYSCELTCTRVGGWRLWQLGELLAGEYDREGLRVDVDGHVICDSLTTTKERKA